MMTSSVRTRLDQIAGQLQELGVALSALVGGLVGLSFAYGAPLAWTFALGGYLSLLWVGMAAVLLSAISERVPGGAWREGLWLSCQIFFGQTTAYALALLALALTPVEAATLPVPRLALATLPGLYLFSVMAIVGSGPLYLNWFPVRHDR